MKTKDCHHFRQGDVLIERIAKIPTAAVKQNKSTRIILAHGEVTGHHHVLEIGDPTDWWKAGEISTASQKPTTGQAIPFSVNSLSVKLRVGFGFPC